MAYQPSSVTTGTASLAHIQNVIYYERTAVENLKANLPFQAATERKRLPNRNGKTLRSYLYDTFAANTTPGSEGAVGTGLYGTSVTRDVTINQYFDFISFSDLVEETAISPLVEEHSAELGYRAALTVNTLTSTEFEVASAVAGTSIDLADNEFLSAAVVRQSVMSQRGANIKSKSDGMFAGVIHPFPAYDLLNDNTIGGVIDILKHVQPGVDTMLRGIQGYRVIDLAGVRFIETTTVPTTAGYPSGAKVGYHTYVVGKDAIFSVSLGATEVPGERNFNLLVKNYRDASVADPANVIGSSVAYNFKYACIRRPGTVMTLRRIRSEASIA
jgi:N4-gp56 family major capsid protein